MLVNKELFDTLCPSYQNAIILLEKEYCDIPEDDYTAKRLLLLEFSHKYLMLKELWDKYFLECRSTIFLTSKMTNDLLDEKYGARTLYHFYGNTEYTSGFKKLLYIKEKYEPMKISEYFTLDEVVAEACCPRAGMDNKFKYCEENAEYPIPPAIKEHFKKMKALYTKIVKAENDQREWFNLLTQVENMEYIENNIEDKLGQNLNNIELWKIYFEFLKQQQDKKRLLHLYSRYCRYFIDDIEMKSEYEEAVKQYGQIIVHWKNAYAFEKYEKQIILHSWKIKSGEIFEPQKRAVKFSADTYEIQTFSLPKTFMEYILTESRSNKPNILHKLHKSCKYLFAIMPYPIYFGMKISNTFYGIIFQGQSVAISCDISKIDFDHKFIISNTLHIFPSMKNTLSRLLLNIHQCNIKHLRIFKQEFTFKEFKFLVDSGNIEIFQMENCNLVDENNVDIELQDILKLMPKVTEFRMALPKTSSLKYEILPKLKFVNKFRILILYRIHYLEPFGFCEFLKNNMSPETQFSGRFDGVDSGIDENIKNAAAKIVQNELKGLWPEVEKNYSFY